MDTRTKIAASCGDKIPRRASCNPDEAVKTFPKWPVLKVTNNHKQSQQALFQEQMNALTLVTVHIRVGSMTAGSSSGDIPWSCLHGSNGRRMPDALMGYFTRLQ